jgi:DNA-binding GntR family transcriptional regulator
MKAQKKSRRIELAGLLESAILDGRLKPGTRLIELKLASDFSASQTSVREALQHLEGTGLVVKHPNKGSYVIKIEPADLMHIYQLRRELEPLAWSLAAAAMRTETLKLLHEFLAQMRTASLRFDHRAHLTADLNFHRVIWQVQPNRYLEKALMGICLPLFAYELVREHANLELDLGRSTRRHECILSAFATGDPVAVKTMIRRLMDRFLRQDLVEYAQLGAPLTKVAAMRQVE